MADPSSYGNPERDIEHALVALKKGTQLIKYSRKGKPKLCPFRISTDETKLIWYSHGEERSLKLSSISRIIPGQRTAVFRRYLRPEKDYLSFSLLYNNGERSLDLICKDKTETEVWFSGLKELISARQQRQHRQSGGFHSEDLGDSIQSNRSSSVTPDRTSSLCRGSNTKLSIDFSSREPSINFGRSYVGSDFANMLLRTSNAESVRVSVSSIPSWSSQGSGQDDCESLGDVYIWGEVWSDGGVSDGPINPSNTKIDVLLPKPLESNMVLDVHQIACGVRHAALVTRQGDVFTWGEESGGRLGHGVDSDVTRPQLVEALASCNVEHVACGEYHTCALSTGGELFTWGDGAHNAGLLGHGVNASTWLPKRIHGPLDGHHVLSIACGTWHTALVTSSGKLFTFGDGTFGVLGHGNRENVTYPREVESLSGLKAIKVSCGVWHTAAIIEITRQQGAEICGKLFTWGDGDNYRLGHGDKEPRLVPTCVPSLIDHNFHRLACGHTMTIGLATKGHIFAMGSTVHGQLGNPQSDGKLPCLVQDRIVGEIIEEIACGANHVAVLTSRNEVFTWGRGANGRLGHGDVEDRKTPTLVEALRDKHIKSISCGSNFTASICIHKWVSTADQSVCSGCRQAFGFTKKRHNCYNCGLVHCHACSSKKASRAALSPTPGKPHRVCDSCYIKLKSPEIGTPSINWKNVVPRRSIDTKERLDRGETRSKVLLSPVTEPVKYLEVKTTKQGIKNDSSPLIRASQVPSLLQLKDISFPSSLSVLQTALKPIVTSNTQPTSNCKPVSPYSGRPSPTRSTSPLFSRSVIDNLNKTNELLNQEVLKLQAKVKSLKQKCEDQESKKSVKKDQSNVSLTSDDVNKYTMLQEVTKSLIAQMKKMLEKLPSDFSGIDELRALQIQAENLITLDRSHSTVTSVTTKDFSTDKQISSDKPIINGGVQCQQIDEADDNIESRTNHNTENGSKSPKDSTIKYSSPGTELIEQFEPGVYVTLIQLRNGTRLFKRVRFSKRKFAEHQAEEWWKENKDRVLNKYSGSVSETSTSGSCSTMPSAEEDASMTSSQVNSGV